VRKESAFAVPGKGLSFKSAFVRGKLLKNRRTKGQPRLYLGKENVCTINDEIRDTSYDHAVYGGESK